MENAILPPPEPGDGNPPTDVAARIAQETSARRHTDYTGEVRRLLDAAMEVIGRTGPGAKTKVVDIVAAADLSNEAFYRHFRSKDALVDALLEEGAERLRTYLAHQMAKESTPEARVRQWVAGVLSQANPTIASTTLAVLKNSGDGAVGATASRRIASGPLAALLSGPFADLGSVDAQREAALVAHGVLGLLADHLWEGTGASRGEVDTVTQFVLRGVGTVPAVDVTR
jgi:AcrR family transcriptional regulator